MGKTRRHNYLGTQKLNWRNHGYMGANKWSIFLRNDIRARQALRNDGMTRGFMLQCNNYILRKDIRKSFGLRDDSNTAPPPSTSGLDVVEHISDESHPILLQLIAEDVPIEEDEGEHLSLDHKLSIARVVNQLKLTEDETLQRSIIEQYFRVNARYPGGALQTFALLSKLDIQEIVDIASNI